MKSKKNNPKKVKDKEIKLHIGGGANYLEGWINIDNTSYGNIEKIDLDWDLTKTLCFKDKSIDLIYDRHFFKKIEMGDKMVESALWNYRCMLKPEGILRIETPYMQLNQKLTTWLNSLGFPHVEFIEKANIFPNLYRKESEFEKKLRMQFCEYLNNDFKQEKYFSNPINGNEYIGNEYTTYRTELFKMTPDKIWKLFRDIFCLSEIEEIYNLFENKESKELFLRVLFYQFLGPKKIKLPLSDNALWLGSKELEEALFVKKFDDTRNEYNLEKSGYDCTCVTSPIWVLENLFLHQYSYQHDNVSICPKKGDYLIDGGACYADNALCFAQMVGDTGKVFSFEALPENLEIIDLNLTKNPHLKDIIVVMKNVLGRTGQQCFLQKKGGASFCQYQESSNTIPITSVSIDELVQSGQSKKVDFIKLDIEGAELETLKGAQNTLKTFKPSLAISLYHRVSDYTTIPLYLKNLVPEYKFYFDHHTAVGWESILYVTTEERNNK